MAIAVLIAVVFYILMLLVDDQHQVTVATSFVFGLSLSLLMGWSFKRRSTVKQIDDAIKRRIANEQRQGGIFRYK